ncbi:MAG: J domain-containing protein [Proteobacteria bacterium]|nr:J domain-containing protein [Pseudomonadota bacterium]
MSLGCHGEDLFDPINATEVARIYSDELYTRLALNREASADDIKKSYRKLVVRYHPDSVRCHPDHKNGELFMKVDEAYQVLSDPEKRANYDGIYNKIFSDFKFKKTNPKSNTYRAKNTVAAEGVEEQIAEKEKLLKLKRKYPELSEIIDGVIREDLDSVIYPQSFRFTERIPILWPSDERLAWIIVKEGTLWLQHHLLYSLLTIPLWGSNNDLLKALLAKGEELHNQTIAEFMYFPHSINPARAQILKQLVSMGYAREVLRSLTLGGASFTSQTESPPVRGQLQMGPISVLSLTGPRVKSKEKIEEKKSKAKINKTPPRKLLSWYDLPEGADVFEDIIINSIPRGDALKAILYRMDIGIQLPHEIERILKQYPEWVRALKLDHLEFIDLIEIQQILLKRHETLTCEPLLLLKEDRKTTQKSKNIKKRRLR